MTTKTGHTFTRIGAEELKKSGVTDTTKFVGVDGAWAEPDSKDGKKGKVWSDIARDEKGKERKMNQRDADAYCKA